MLLDLVGLMNVGENYRLKFGWLPLAEDVFGCGKVYLLCAGKKHYSNRLGNALAKSHFICFFRKLVLNQRVALVVQRKAIVG